MFPTLTAKYKKREIKLVVTKAKQVQEMKVTR
jgi:hypothetical protein